MTSPRRSRPCRRRTPRTSRSSSSVATTSPTASRRPSRWATSSACVQALHDRGTRVVVGTCPDLGALRAVPQPLRAIGSRASRQLAAAQGRAVGPMGARVVSLADAVGPYFVAFPDDMFSLDRFHPSSLGYKRTAQALLPDVIRGSGGLNRADALDKLSPQRQGEHVANHQEQLGQVRQDRHPADQGRRHRHPPERRGERAAAPRQAADRAGPDGLRDRHRDRHRHLRADRRRGQEPRRARRSRSPS